jgi:YaiO family outer membrane protein
VELSGTLNRRSPYEIYGGPKILTLGYFQTQSPTFSFFGEASAHDWKEGQAVFFSGGAFKDWTQRLYTFTAAGLGSDSTFLPHYRVDQDFNFKVGEKKNVVLTAGGSFIRYHDVHKDTLLAGGLAWYLGSWVANYRLTRIQSDPGGVLSTNHLFSVNQGYVGRRSDALTVSFGSQGYIATVVSPEEGVYSDTFFVEGRHRQWLKEDLGAFLYLHYNSVSDVFVERGATLGVFFEY